jgi:2,3-dihydroxybenzoate-AMP ligase
VLPGFVPWPADVAARYRRDGYWPGSTLGELVRRSAAAGPDAAAIVTRRTRWTYRELDERADRLAAGLRRLGVRAGDRVVVQLPNEPEFLMACLALLRLGAPPVLVLPAHRRTDLAYVCERTEAVAWLIPDTLRGFDFRVMAREVARDAPALRHVLVAGEAGEFTALADVSADPEPLPEPDPADVAFLMLSGGTTGAPKLIPRTHDDYAYQMRATAQAMGMDAGGAYLAALPMAHNAALGCPGVLGTLVAGGTAVLASSPSPDEVLPLIERENVTLTTLMPSVLQMWVDVMPLLGAALPGLVVEVGGARLEHDLARLARTRLGVTLTQWFGMAEGLLCFTRLDDPPDLAVTTAGRPLSDADEIRVTDELDRDVPPGAVGQLLVRGPYTLRGYYRAEQYNAVTFTADGFFRTGDLVRRTLGGDLVVEGRVKDVINRGGEKISAAELEDHLRTHPAISDAAAVAIPDRVLGERACAFVVLDDELTPGELTPGELTLGELRAYLVGRGLADYKLPERLEVVDALPYTGIGKVDKVALRAQAVGRIGVPASGVPE